MSAPEPRSALAGLRGARPMFAGVRIEEVPHTLIQLAARRGRGADVAAALRRGFGIDLPPPGKSAMAERMGALWLQPDTWLITAPRGTEGALARDLRRVLVSAGSVVDQTHGRTTLRLSGEHARSVMAKGCRIDLHPSVFGPGDVASTLIAHVGCLIHQTDARPSYDLMVFATLARPFLEWLEAAAAEFT